MEHDRLAHSTQPSQVNPKSTLEDIENQWYFILDSLNEGSPWLILVWGVLLIFYRLPLTRCNFKRRTTLRMIRVAIGWTVSVIFCRLFTSKWDAVAGLVGAILSQLTEWLSVHAVASFLGALVCSCILAIPHECVDCSPIKNPTLADSLMPDRYFTIAAIIASAGVVSTLFLLVTFLAKSWELVGLPLLGSYACLSPWLPDVLLHPYEPRSPFQPHTLWATCGALALIACIIQVMCRTERSIDLEDPYGAQNDIVKALLENETVSNSQIFQSRFPTITKSFEDQGAGNPYLMAKYPTPMPAQGQSLTDHQIKLLNACREDEEQRNRILFGGGLY